MQVLGASFITCIPDELKQVISIHLSSAKEIPMLLGSTSIVGTQSRIDAPFLPYFQHPAALVSDGNLLTSFTPTVPVASSAILYFHAHAMFMPLHPKPVAMLLSRIPRAEHQIYQLPNIKFP